MEADFPFLGVSSGSLCALKLQMGPGGALGRKFLKSGVNPGWAVFGAGSSSSINSSCGRKATSVCASVLSCVRVAACARVRSRDRADALAGSSPALDLDFGRDKNFWFT